MIRQTKNTFLMLTNCRFWGIALIALFTCLLASQDMYGQDLGGGGGDIADLQQLQQTGNTGAIGGGGGGTGGGGVGNIGPDAADLFGGFQSNGEILDRRNQGFVGVTAERIQELGFVGPPGETSGPDLQDGASIGGGVNDDQGSGGGGGGGNFNGGNQQNGFGGIGGQAKGFQVIRKGVRTALTPRFASPSRNTTDISSRFNNRIGRLPTMANDGGGLYVSINQRVATVSGYAQTEAERNRFIRQLRLEPGVDRVIDQASSQ